MRRQGLLKGSRRGGNILDSAIFHGSGKQGTFVDLTGNIALSNNGVSFTTVNSRNVWTFNSTQQDNIDFNSDPAIEDIDLTFAFFYRPSTASVQTLLSRGLATVGVNDQYGYRIYIGGSNNVVYERNYGQSGASNLAASSSSISATTDYVIFITYTKSTGNVAFYLNNVADGSTVINNSGIVYNVNRDNGTDIGVNDLLIAQQFWLNGLCDDVIIFDSVLPSEDLTELFDFYKAEYGNIF